MSYVESDARHSFWGDFMSGAIAGRSGTIDQHSWLLHAMLDMAAYAELHGLSNLHQQLCHLVSSAATEDLAGCFESQESFGSESR